MTSKTTIAQMLALIAMSTAFVGCSGGGNGFTSNTTTNNNTTVVIPSGSGVTPPVSTPSVVAPNSVGTPVTMTVASDSALSTYTLGHASSANQVSNVQIGVSLSNYDSGASGGAYGGTVTVSYMDALGNWHTGVFQALNATTPNSVWDGANKFVSNLNHAAYNRWFSQNGKSVFHGFYADPYGAIMLVVTGGLDLGDGNGVSSLTGEIWFKNYVNAAPYNYPNPVGTPCWFLSLGQYECRTFLVDGDSGYGVLNTTSALTPDQSQYTQNKNPYIPASLGVARGWQKLGTFSGLNRIQGFGQ